MIPIAGLIGSMPKLMIISAVILIIIIFLQKKIFHMNKKWIDVFLLYGFILYLLLLYEVLMGILQYFVGRSADIDDVIMNVTGAIIGYLCFKCVMACIDFFNRVKTL